MPLLRDELVFYGSYHAKQVNQLIHFIFVPAIIFSVLVWLAYIGPTVPVDTSALTKHWPKWIAVVSDVCVNSLAIRCCSIPSK
jgi:uncharacterized membrane protein YGL010W